MATYSKDSGGSVESLGGFSAASASHSVAVETTGSWADVELDRAPTSSFESSPPSGMDAVALGGAVSAAETHQGIRHHPAPAVANTFPIPTGPFEPVRVAIVDENENLITGRALWLLPAEKFPVAVRPREGFATLRLVNGEVYDKFQLLVQNPDGPDVVLYEESEVEVAASDDQAILQFDTGPFNLGEEWDGWGDDDGEGDIAITNEDLFREVRRRSGGVSIF